MAEMHQDPLWNGVSHEAKWMLVWVSSNTGPPLPGEGILQCWCGQVKALPAQPISWNGKLVMAAADGVYEVQDV